MVTKKTASLFSRILSRSRPEPEQPYFMVPAYGSPSDGFSLDLTSKWEAETDRRALEAGFSPVGWTKYYTDQMEPGKVYENEKTGVRLIAAPFYTSEIKPEPFFSDPRWGGEGVDPIEPAPNWANEAREERADLVRRYSTPYPWEAAFAGQAPAGDGLGATGGDAPKSAGLGSLALSAGARVAARAANSNYKEMLPATGIGAGLGATVGATVGALSGDEMLDDEGKPMGPIRAALARGLQGGVAGGVLGATFGAGMGVQRRQQSPKSASLPEIPIPDVYKWDMMEMGATQPELFKGLMTGAGALGGGVAGAAAGGLLGGAAGTIFRGRRGDGRRRGLIRSMLLRGLQGAAIGGVAGTLAGGASGFNTKPPGILDAAGSRMPKFSL